MNKSRCKGGGIKWRDTPELACEKEYGDKADALAATLVADNGTGNQCWGRWRLTETSLDTVIALPYEGKGGYWTTGIYSIPLDRLDEEWLPHMAAKRFIGIKGLKDLADAMAEVEVSASATFSFGRWWCEDNSLNTTVRCLEWVGNEGSSKVFSIPISKIYEDWLGKIEDKEYVGEKGLADLGAALSFMRQLVPFKDVDRCKLMLKKKNLRHYRKRQRVSLALKRESERRSFAKEVALHLGEGLYKTSGATIERSQT